MTQDLLTSPEPSELWNDNIWDRLLESVHDQKVIPIIGPDLLQVEVDGEAILVDQYIARRLVRKNKLPGGDLPAEKPLNYVVCQLTRLGKDRDSICDDIFQIMKEARFQPSESLRRLAEITDFNLFVSTTFDGLLEKAINDVRFGSAQRTLSIAYSPNNPLDLPSAKAQLSRPTVYYLMGKLSAIPRYVISEEDLLEYVCELQSESRRPKMLFDELKKNHLLILGENFSDWLARFFLRTAKGGRLSSIQGFEILADNNSHRDPSLVSFLLHFSSRTRVFRAGGTSGGAVEFVDELWKRWSQQRPQLTAASESPGRREMPRNAIFISYAREDQAAVQELNAGLEAAGLPVWFDNEQLGPGDNWSPQIEQYILKGCSCFVAVISKNTEKRKEGFFRREWNLAVERDKGIHGKNFIVPVVVDDTETPEAVPLRFADLHYTWLPGGRVTPPLVQVLRKIIGA